MLLLDDLGVFGDLRVVASCLRMAGIEGRRLAWEEIGDLPLEPVERWCFEYRSPSGDLPALACLRLLCPPSREVLGFMPFGFGEGPLPLVCLATLGGLVARFPSACLGRFA